MQWGNAPPKAKLVDVNTQDPSAPPAGSVEHRLLDQALQILGRGDKKALTLQRTAEQADIPLEEARTLYADDATLYAEVSRFLDERLRVFADRELAKLPADAPTLKHVLANATGYFNAALDNPTYFAAYSHSQVVEDFPNFEEQIERPLNPDDFPAITARVLNLILEATRQLETPIQESLIITGALALLAETHGLAHLATFGIMRHLSPTAKRQTFQAAMGSLLSGLCNTMAEGNIVHFDPETIPGEISEPWTTLAKDLPRETKEEIREAILRGAAEEVVAAGLDGFTLKNAAQRADIAFNTATQLFDGDQALLHELEIHLDEANTQAIVRQAASVPEGSPALTAIKAAGFGYIDYALADPTGFVALIEISSRSIVPVSFDDEGGMAQPFDMGKAFTYLMNIVRDAISESEGPRSTWVLYTQMMSLWGAAHGIAQLATIGVLRYTSPEFCFRVSSRVMDIGLRGMINALELREP